MGKYCVIVKAVILFAVLTAAVTSCTPPGGGGGGDKYPQITITHGAQDIISGTTQIDFGGVEENTSSDAFEFTIQNTGGADLSLTGLPLVQISGDDAAEFLLTQPGTGLLSPGASTTFGITFTPHSTGSKT
ncbi:MAG: choice-of-anchor D domain-containing protein, partial [Spirochaetia bacterium]